MKKSVLRFQGILPYKDSRVLLLNVVVKNSDTLGLVMHDLHFLFFIFIIFNNMSWQKNEHLSKNSKREFPFIEC